MRSEPEQIPAAKSCKCGARPVYFSYDDPSKVIFHRVQCTRCRKRVTSLSKFRALIRWNEYMMEVKSP